MSDTVKESEKLEELVSNACEEAADYASSPAVHPPASYPARDALLDEIDRIERESEEARSKAAGERIANKVLNKRILALNEQIAKLSRHDPGVTVSDRMARDVVASIRGPLKQEIEERSKPLLTGQASEKMRKLVDAVVYHFDLDPEDTVDLEVDRKRLLREIGWLETVIDQRGKRIQEVEEKVSLLEANQQETGMRLVDQTSRHTSGSPSPFRTDPAGEQGYTTDQLDAARADHLRTVIQPVTDPAIGAALAQADITQESRGPADEESGDKQSLTTTNPNFSSTSLGEVCRPQTPVEDGFEDGLAPAITNEELMAIAQAARRAFNGPQTLGEEMPESVARLVARGREQPKSYRIAQVRDILWLADSRSRLLTALEDTKQLAKELDWGITQERRQNTQLHEIVAAKDIALKDARAKVDEWAAVAWERHLDIKRLESASVLQKEEQTPKTVRQVMEERGIAPVSREIQEMRIDDACEY